MKIPAHRCGHCRKALSDEEIHYYGNACHDCESDSLARLNEVSGVRLVVLVLALWWRRICGTLGMMAERR